MAFETTTNVQAPLIAAHVIRDRVISAQLPRLFAMGLICHDSMDGEGSNTVRYARYADLGAASGGTEGVDLTPQFTHGMDPSIELSPTEAIADMSLITEDTVLRRLGGTPFRTVRDAFNGSQQQIGRLLDPDVSRQTARGLQKYEQDLMTTMMTAPSVSAGLTNTSLSMLTIISALRKMKINQPFRPPSEWAFLLPTAGTEDLQLEALSANGGGYQGTLWGGGQAKFGIANKPVDSWQNDGLLGDILGVDVYEHDDELKVTANANVDVCGLLFCRGDPSRSPNDYQGKVPSFVFVERSPLEFMFEFDKSMRAAELINNARYIFGELADNNHVGLIIKND